jgi:hypothetical protein
MTVHPHFSQDPPSHTERRGRKSAVRHGSILAIAVMLGIGALAFGSMLPRSTVAVDEPATTGQGAGPTAIVPIADPLADGQ